MYRLCRKIIAQLGTGACHWLATLRESTSLYSTWGMQTACIVAGVDDMESYELLCHFVRTVSSQSRVRHFVLHARKCLLQGLSPAENRTIPPLRCLRLVHSLWTVEPQASICACSPCIWICRRYMPAWEESVTFASICLSVLAARQCCCNCGKSSQVARSSKTHLQVAECSSAIVCCVMVSLIYRSDAGGVGCMH